MTRIPWLLLVVLVMGCGELVVDYGDTQPSTKSTSWDTQDMQNNQNQTSNNKTSANNVNNVSSNNASTNNVDPDPACDAPEKTCGDICVNVATSDEHCGACDQACPGESMCTAGACQCAGIQDLCGGACVDTTLSNAHCGGCDMPCGGGELCVNGACAASTEVQGVIQAVNVARAAGADCGVYGMFEPVPALEGDDNLHIAAQAHADDMGTNNFFDHTGSDGSSFSQRIGRTAFSGQPLGENIAAGGREAAGVVARWIDSDGHCRNIMNPAATKIGVGYAQGGPYGTSWVQVFAR